MSLFKNAKEVFILNSMLETENWVSDEEFVNIVKMETASLYVVVDEVTEEELSSTFKTEKEATNWMNNLSDDIIDNGIISIWPYAEWISFKSGF